MTKIEFTVIKGLDILMRREFTASCDDYPIIAWDRNIEELKNKVTNTVAAYVRFSFRAGNLPFTKKQK